MRNGLQSFPINLGAALFARAQGSLLQTPERVVDFPAKSSLIFRQSQIHRGLGFLTAHVGQVKGRGADAYQAEYLARRQRTERLAAIGQVAGGVAHELRNPLNVVKTSVYYLLNAKHPTAEKTAEHLKRIERHVTLADGVITALSSFATMPVPNLQSFPVGQCVHEALTTNPVADNIRVTIDCPSSLPPVLADIDQSRIVFASLIRNARGRHAAGRFSFDQGTGGH